jgi:hypothetical protein
MRLRFCSLIFPCREIPLKTACFEEKIHRDVEEVEKGREKKNLRAKTSSTSSTFCGTLFLFRSSGLWLFKMENSYFPVLSS